MKEVGGWLVGLVVVVALCVSAYAGYWWLYRDTGKRSTNINTSIANDSLARQQGLLDAVLKDKDDIAKLDVTIAAITAPEQVTALKAQRVALVDDFCHNYGGLTGRLTAPASVQAFAQGACT